MDIADDDIDIDNRVSDLLARGLERYGEGDLEGALAHWKHALILDPDSEKAAQYASYVEDNHDLAESGADALKHAAELDYPFGIQELGLAKLKDDELADDYESLVVEDSKRKSEPAKTEAKATANKSAELDDGWDVDEGWVSDLVENSETAFAVPEEQNKAEPKTDDEAPKTDEPKKAASKVHERPTARFQPITDTASDEEAGSEGFDDFDLDSIDAGQETKSVDSSELLAASAAAKPMPAEDEADEEDDEDEEDDDDYAELEIGVALDAPAASFEADDDDEGDLELSLDDKESDFGGLNLDDDAGDDIGGFENEEVDEASLPKIPSISMELGASGARLDGEAKPSVDEIEIGDAGAPAARPRAGSSVFDANEPGDVDLPDDSSDDEVLAWIESEAPSGDSNERSTFIVGKLVERALTQHGCGKHESASFSAGAALAEADDCAAAQKLIYENEDDLVSVLMAGLGEPDKVPELVVPLTEIPLDQIDNRAAFLLTRVDGSLSLEEILVVCGMPKLEALRHLSRLHSRSYLSVQ